MPDLRLVELPGDVATAFVLAGLELMAAIERAPAEQVPDDAALYALVMRNLVDEHLA